MGHWPGHVALASNRNSSPLLHQKDSLISDHKGSCLHEMMVGERWARQIDAALETQFRTSLRTLREDRQKVMSGVAHIIRFRPRTTSPFRSARGQLSKLAQSR
jgi:hypothetical protein